MPRPLLVLIHKLFGREKLLCVSGQLPLDPKTGEMCTASIDECVRLSLNNIKEIVTEARVSMDDLVKTTVFLANMADSSIANQVYAEIFTEPFPARSAFQVAALPLGGSVEIEAIVVLVSLKSYSFCILCLCVKRKE